jgi:hypothetical protein
MGTCHLKGHDPDWLPIWWWCRIPPCGTWWWDHFGACPDLTSYHTSHKSWCVARREPSDPELCDPASPLYREQVTRWYVINFRPKEVSYVPGWGSSPTKYRMRVHVSSFRTPWDKGLSGLSLPWVQNLPWQHTRSDPPSVPFDPWRYEANTANEASGKILLPVLPDLYFDGTYIRPPFCKHNMLTNGNMLPSDQIMRVRMPGLKAPWLGWVK